ncbi:MAG: ABC transporter ATP-binding protein [Proteobacteria bacterium]|nr:ABC transporter ATP-binding protein [Pseudomonadota bacterium]
MLEVRGLRAGYGPMQVLHGIDLDVARGEIVAILGANGAGKSTLNNNISGIFRPFAGTIRFEGKEITARPPEQIVDAGLIQVPEGRRVFPNLTVRDNLLLGAYRRGRARRSANIDRVCGIFPRLRERIAQIAGTLSGGEQQMLAIARALMSEPRLLILDEPSLGLSPILVEEMFTLTRDLNADGLAILLVEQNVLQSLEIANRAYVLENGVFVMQDTPAALLADDQLKRAYLGI